MGCVSQKSSEPIGTVAASPEVKIVTSEIRDAENAFFKNDCVNTLEHGKKIGVSREALPLSIQIAHSFCDAEASKDSKKAVTAIEIIDSAKQQKADFFNFSYLENLKSKLYLIQNNKEKALEAKRKSRSLAGTEEEKLNRENDIVQMEAEMTAMTPELKSQLKEIIEKLKSKENLFAALNAVDNLISSSPKAEWRSVYFGAREFIVQRIEQNFAVDSAQVEHKLATSRENEARTHINLMKSQYPLKQYQKRIESLVPSTSNNPAALAVAPSPGTNVESPPGDEAAVEKAIADARTAMDSGNLGKAVDVLDGLPPNLITENTRRLRREAAEQHVRELRARVRDIYQKAQSQRDPQQKIDALVQSKQLLELILTRYPDNSVRTAVERNLRSLNSEITAIGKKK